MKLKENSKQNKKSPSSFNIGNLSPKLQITNIVNIFKVREMKTVRRKIHVRQAWMDETTWPKVQR